MVIIAAVLVFTPPLAAQEKPADPAAKTARGKLSQASKSVEAGQPAPEIFFPEPLHDFGTIASGSKVSHNFKVINKGDAPLQLIKAKGS